MTMASKIFIVELNKSSEHLPRSARRIIVNSEFLKAGKLSTGDLVALSTAETSSSRNLERYAVGVIWPSLDIAQDAILVSSSLLLTAGLAAGEGARIFSLSSSAPGFPSIKNVKDAESIRLHEVKPYKNATSLRAPSSPKTYRDWLTLAARELLVDLRYITNKQMIELTFEGQSRCFSIGAIASKGESNIDEDISQRISVLSIDTPASSQLWKVDWDCVISYESKDDAKVSTLEANEQQAKVEVLVHQPSQNAYASVGGLDKQIEVVRDLLEIPLTRPELFRYFGLKPPRGILLHGPPGTGKTHLARAIASATEASVLIINGPELSSAYHGETESKLRDVFQQAREKSPCIVVLDEIDALVPRREDGAGGEVEKRVVATLLTILDGMGNEREDSRVIIIGTTNRPNAIDPALRRPGRFDREIEIGVPDAEARFSILNVLLANTPHNVTRDDLLSLAGRMYGYVGADIAAVVREAGTLSIKKWLYSKSGISSQRTSVPETLKLELADLVAAMPSVRPSAMRSLFIETPPVHYSDIGGQASVIQKLREVVEWPLLHPEAFCRLGVKPPKGLLLYGPPGCSKTILARACACESGVNFVAVKGPELFNKFLGESERAVREIFRKARAASPSIIFFDEIDALASTRASDNERASSHDGILTSLLNEMDGVQELTGVTVIGATNRPEALDSALMRPGRFDRILWVGPPDQAGREDILRIKTRTMAVGADVDIRVIAELTEGCSGAEISSLCQEAAITTMQGDLNASHVPQEAFVAAAKSVRRQLTASVLEQFARWSNGCNIHTL